MAILVGRVIAAHPKGKQTCFPRGTFIFASGSVKHSLARLSNPPRKFIGNRRRNLIAHAIFFREGEDERDDARNDSLTSF